MIFSKKRKHLLRWVIPLLLLGLLTGCTTHASRPEHLKESDVIDAFESLEETESETEPKKRVALTFDDGPNHYNKTKVVVDELAKYGFHATFFVVGNRIPDGDSVVYAAEHGNEIGIHGYTHAEGVYYDTCSLERYEEELNKTAEAIHRVLPDYKIRLMRPVGGRISLERTANCPYAVIHWSVDSDDWNNRY